MQQTMHSQTKIQTTSTTSAPPRKGYALWVESDGVTLGHEPLFSPASTSAAAKASILPDLRFAISLLQLGELEGERINQAAARDEWPATCSDDPQLKRIVDIAVEQPRPLCDALFLLLDGWYRHCQSAPDLATPETRP